MTLPLLDEPATGKPLRLAALDLSLTAAGTAATHHPDGTPGLTVHTIKPATDGHERLQDIVRGVARLTQFMPQLVLIERLPLQYQHGLTTARLVELHALVKQFLWTMGIPYLLINPAHIKIYATGSGRPGHDRRTDKAAVLRAMQHRYPVYVEDDNQADALAALCLACHAYGHPLAAVPDTHSRAVCMVQWPPLYPSTALGAHMAPRLDPPPAGVTRYPPAGAATEARSYR